MIATGLPEQVANAAQARELYQDNLNPAGSLADWRFAVRDARKAVAAALRASKFLTDITGALIANNGHSLVFRHAVAPPVSQDQFKILCTPWSKGAENNSKPATPAAAAAAEAVILERLDRGLARWVGKGSNPTRGDIRKFLTVVPALMAQQKVATARRKRLAFEQEYAVIDMLQTDGWTRLPSRLIDQRAAVPPKHFMHKTRFASGPEQHQEVDVACGLKGTYVVAIECKSTNDETNSVKRINDVLKKASAWKLHWGSFVITAALLQGVIAPKDVRRLTDAGVEVFWSHDLDAFKAWLNARL